jgi:hypothetical protein
VSGQSAIIRAHLTAAGAPLTAEAIAFTLDGRPLSVSSTDANGVATAVVIPAAPGRHSIGAEFKGSSTARRSSDSTSFTAVPGPP